MLGDNGAQSGNGETGAFYNQSYARAPSFSMMKQNTPINVFNTFQSGATNYIVQGNFPDQSPAMQEGRSILTPSNPATKSMMKGI